MSEMLSKETPIQQIGIGYPIGIRGAKVDPTPGPWESRIDLYAYSGHINPPGFKDIPPQVHLSVTYSRTDSSTVGIRLNPEEIDSLVAALLRAKSRIVAD